MEITKIRNATLKIEYGGVCFLVDPWLQDVGSITSFVESGTFKNPIVPLPMPVNEVLSGVDCYVITHVHPDHLDLTFESLENMTFAAHVLDKAVAVVVQGEEDAAFMREAGFRGARGDTGRPHRRIAFGCRRPYIGDSRLAASLCC